METIRIIAKRIRRTVPRFLERVLIFLLSIIFIGCTNRTPDEKKDIKIVYATDYSEVGRDFILNKDLDYIFPDSTFVLDGHMKFHPITENEYRLAKMELTTFLKLLVMRSLGIPNTNLYS